MKILINNQNNSAIWRTLTRIYNTICPIEHFIETLCTELSPHKPQASPVNFNPDHWNLFLRVIRQNQLQIILASSFNIHDSFPPSIAHAITTDILMTEHQVTQQQKVYTHLLSLFNEKNISYIVMKTLPLTKRLYPDDIKASCDLDILLPVSEFQKAATVLDAEGFIYYKTYDLIGNDTNPASNFYSPKGEEIFKKGMYTVEVHTSIINTFSTSTHILNEIKNRQMTNEIYIHARRTTYDDIQVQVPSPTYLFLSLFLHLHHQHAYQSVVRFYESAQILQIYKSSISWMHINSFMHTYNLNTYFLWYVSFMHDLFPGVLPKNIIKRVIDARKLWSTLQVITYFITKYFLFHPIDKEYSENKKRLIWAIIDGHAPHALLKIIKSKIKDVVG